MKDFIFTHITSNKISDSHTQGSKQLQEIVLKKIFFGKLSKIYRKMPVPKCYFTKFLVTSLFCQKETLVKVFSCDISDTFIKVF